MQRRWPKAAAYLVTIIFFGFALLGVAGRASQPPLVRASVARTTPAYAYSLFRVLPRPKVTGFYENTASTPHGSGSFAAFSSHAHEIDVVSPRWFAIGPSGAIAKDMSQTSVVLRAKRDHVMVMPMVTNLGSNMVTSPAARAATVRSLVRIGTRSGYGGVIVDFELLPPNARPGLSALVAETALRLHRSGRQVGISVFPKVGIGGALPLAYDYAKLGKSVDEMVLMAYDHHYDGGPPGPVAPYGWVDANLRYMLRFVPRKRVYLGLAFYGYDWSSPSGGSATTLSIPEAYANAKAAGVPVRWVASSGEATYTYSQGGGQHVVWFETPHSLAERASLARRYGVGGVAIWRLGFGTASTWPAMLHALSTGHVPATPAGAQQAAAPPVVLPRSVRA